MFLETVLFEITKYLILLRTTLSYNRALENAKDII